MSRITGKFQLTLPKRLAETYGIRVGDEVQLVASGDTISIVPARAAKALIPVEERLRLFDAATRRQRPRNARGHAPVTDRGWTREELYIRARTD